MLLSTPEYCTVAGPIKLIYYSFLVFYWDSTVEVTLGENLLFLKTYLPIFLHGLAQAVIAILAF